nr:imidazoleglycerol-phosphate dehydratase [bacterium]
MSKRTASQARNTAETKIKLSLNLDGSGKSSIATRIPFFDHMLTLFSRHSLIDLNLQVDGDVEVDFHHT